MPRGGYRPGAGRPRKNPEETGAKAPSRPAKSAAGNQKAKDRLDLTPLEYMLDVINDPSADIARRDRMALAAAPFVHGKMAEVVAGKKERQKQAAEKLAEGGGRFATRSGPRLAVDNK